MNDTPALPIHVIDDDDAAFRRSLVFLLESMGWPVATHASAEDFLAAGVAPDAAACLVLDIRMPMMSGRELQQALLQRGWAVPIVFLTGHGDVELAVQAMKHGACDFLEKPFKDQALIDAVVRDPPRLRGARAQRTQRGRARPAGAAAAANRAVRPATTRTDDAGVRRARATPAGPGAPRCPTPNPPR